MSERRESCSEAAFEAKYRKDADPWHFATSSYERGRYAATLQALSKRFYETAFEPGCSVGELTAALAPLCKRVIATDLAPTAVLMAQRRCAGFSNVQITCADLERSIPDEPLDLVVFSEIGYYFPRDELRRISAAVAARLRRGGEWIAVHWLGHSPDHILHGDEVHEELMATLPMTWSSGSREDGFRIDTWVNP